MKPRIVLTMIVKDEEHVIERALSSCYKMIDSYCIVDTGSTDLTKEKIKNFFGEKGIEGKIVDFPFTNFEECRNVSIKEAEELGEYGFWMDADEQLILNDTFNKTFLTDYLKNNNYDQLLIQCNYGNMTYARAQFYKLDVGFEWTGPVHEVLVLKSRQSSVGSFTFGKMFIQADGASWQDPDIYKKYEEHARILLEYQEKNNWEDPRWTFYLAQSYRDAGNLILEKEPKSELGLTFIKKSIQFYTERAEDTRGFYQEIYFSLLMVSRLSYHVSGNSTIVGNLMKCEENNPDFRVEHLFNLVSYLQSENLHKNALLYTTKALSYIKNKKEINSTALFREDYIYDWAMYDMHGISLYYTGDIEQGLKFCKHSLKKAQNEHATNPDIERISNNVKSIQAEIDRIKNLSQSKGNIKI